MGTVHPSSSSLLFFIAGSGHASALNAYASDFKPCWVATGKTRHRALCEQWEETRERERDAHSLVLLHFSFCCPLDGANTDTRPVRNGATRYLYKQYLAVFWDFSSTNAFDLPSGGGHSQYPVEPALTKAIGFEHIHNIVNNNTSNAHIHTHRKVCVCVVLTW